MRSSMFVVAALALLGGVQALPAQASSTKHAPITDMSSSRGFAWFFAHVRPQGTCTGGRQVVATWYASGRRTASGQAFNSRGHTAAHRTLPFGSRVTITNPHNGRSVTVVVNDRGPFTRGVTIDLAHGAASSIGMHSTQWVCMASAGQQLANEQR